VLDLLLTQTTSLEAGPGGGEACWCICVVLCGVYLRCDLCCAVLTPCLPVIPSQGQTSYTWTVENGDHQGRRTTDQDSFDVSGHQVHSEVH
jgi:hypothetical protein